RPTRFLTRHLIGQFLPISCISQVRPTQIYLLSCHYLLEDFVSSYYKPSPERLMPPYYLVQCCLKRRDLDPPRESNGRRDIVKRAFRRKLVQEPKAFLAKGCRRRCAIALVPSRSHRLLRTALLNTLQ